MRRKWKCLSVLCLAGLLGFMVPMSTMKAAEGAETPEAVSENDLDYVLQEVEVDENAKYFEQQAKQTYSIDEAGGEPVALIDGETSGAEADTGIKITIWRDGDDITSALGASVNYNVYFGQSSYKSVRVEVTGDSEPELFYCLCSDEDVDTSIDSDLDSLSWQQVDSGRAIPLPQDDGRYVVYVKAVSDAQDEQDGETTYAVSKGIVIDTVAPQIVDSDGNVITSGMTYPAGMEFRITDDNLNVNTVMINDQPAVSENEIYMIPDGRSTCVIKAEDMAGNKAELIINVAEAAQKPDENVITQSGEYFLEAGVKYQLGDGNWVIANVGNWMAGGDGTVYQSGITFYVGEDKTYYFMKF